MAKILKSAKTKDSQGQTVYEEVENCFVESYKEENKYIIKDGKIREIITAIIHGEVNKGNIIRTEQGDYTIIMIGKTMFSNRKIIGEKI